MNRSWEFTTGKTAMKRTVGIGLYVLLLLCFSAVALSETMYIRTVVRITLRTGPGVDHKIISMVQSGQEVEVLDRGESWSKVQTERGQIGWVMTNLLTSEKPIQFTPASASSQDEALAQRQAAVLKENRALASENTRLTTELSETKTELDALNASFDSLKEASGDYLELKAEHQKTAAMLREQTEKAKATKDAITDLQFQQNIWWFLAGALVLFVGFIIGYSVKRQRRRSILM